jgi:hypothetical protein
MSKHLTEVELSRGSGVDFGPGADWEYFTINFFNRELLNPGFMALGQFTGQLVIEHFGTSDLAQVLTSARRFGLAADPPAIHGSYRLNFERGIDHAIKLAEAKEAIV